MVSFITNNLNRIIRFIRLRRDKRYPCRFFQALSLPPAKTRLYPLIRLEMALKQSNDPA